jgi:hypothetical protein
MHKPNNTNLSNNVIISDSGSATAIASDVGLQGLFVKLSLALCVFPIHEAPSLAPDNTDQRSFVESEPAQ